jgi:hypothetical protein
VTSRRQRVAASARYSPANLLARSPVLAHSLVLARSLAAGQLPLFGRKPKAATVSATRASDSASLPFDQALLKQRVDLRTKRTVYGPKAPHTTKMDLLRAILGLKPDRIRSSPVSLQFVARQDGRKGGRDEREGGRPI